MIWIWVQPLPRWGGGSKLRSGHWRSLLLRERSPNERGGTLWRLARCTLTFCNVAEGRGTGVFMRCLWLLYVTIWTHILDTSVCRLIFQFPGEMVTSIARWNKKAMAFVAILSQPWPRNWKWFHMVLFLGWLFSTHSAFGVLWLVQVRGFVGWWGSGNPGNIVLLIWRFLKGSGIVGQIVGLVTDTRLVSGNVWNPLCSIRHLHLHNISNPKRSWFSQSE